MSFNKESSKKNSTEVELLKQRGARLAEVRELLGFKTLDDFGKALADENGKSIDKSTLSKMERGIMSISKKVLVELTSKFSVNADYILYNRSPRVLNSGNGKHDKIEPQDIKNIPENNTSLSGNALDLSLTKNINVMIDRLLNLLERGSSNMEIIAGANSTLAQSLNTLINQQQAQESKPLKRRAG